MLVIGITGPTGCGKTTLLQAVQRLSWKNSRVSWQTTAP